MYFLLIAVGISLSTLGSLPPSSKKMRIAVTRGKKRDVQECLSRGESPMSTWPKGGMTPLMMAIKWEKSEIAQLLITGQLADQAKLENDSAQTPLYFAAEAANITLLEALLKAGAKIDHTDANGLSALYAAIKGLQIHNKPEHIQAIKLLLHVGAYPYPEQKKLWEMVVNTHNQEVIQLLAPYFVKQKVG